MREIAAIVLLILTIAAAAGAISWQTFAFDTGVTLFALMVADKVLD